MSTLTEQTTQVRQALVNGKYRTIYRNTGPVLVRDDLGETLAVLGQIEQHAQEMEARLADAERALREIEKLDTRYGHLFYQAQQIARAALAAPEKTA